MVPFSIASWLVKMPGSLAMAGSSLASAVSGEHLWKLHSCASMAGSSAMLRNCSASSFFFEPALMPQTSVPATAPSFGTSISTGMPSFSR